MAERYKTQEFQESEYGFPYHYISSLPTDGFRQHRVDTWGINYVSTMEFLLDRIRALSPATVIDIGCGDGRFTREVRCRFPDLEDITGVDYSERAVSLAKALNADIPSITFERWDITSVSLARKFGMGILMEVFEHIPIDEADDFIKAVSVRIETGGHLLLTVPHVNKPLEYKHFQHFTEASLRRYLEPYFVIEEILPFERKGLHRRMLNRLLCNRLFVLNNQKLLDLAYRLHQSFLFHCRSEAQCQRLFVQARNLS